MKRYRNEQGQLTATLDQIKKETLEEAKAYYQFGKIYLFSKENREYVYIEADEELTHFESFDGYHLFIPNENLGTYLPDVASNGMELTLCKE